MKTLFQFFTPVEKKPKPAVITVRRRCQLEKRLKRLEHMLLDKSIKLRREVFMKALAVSKVLEGRLEGKGKIAAAQAVASMLPGKTRKTWSCRRHHDIRGHVQ